METQLSVLYIEVYLIQRYVNLYTALWFGQRIVTSLERCLLFKVSFMERFHCTYVSHEVVRSAIKGDKEPDLEFRTGTEERRLRGEGEWEG